MSEQAVMVSEQAACLWSGPTVSQQAVSLWSVRTHGVRTGCDGGRTGCMPVVS